MVAAEEAVSAVESADTAPDREADTAWPSLDAAAEVDTARVVYMAPEMPLPMDRALPALRQDEQR